MQFFKSALQILAKYVLIDQSAKNFFLDADQCYQSFTLHQEYKSTAGNSLCRPFLHNAQLINFGIKQNSHPGKFIL